MKCYLLYAKMILQRSVGKVMQTAIKMQMLLQFKLEDVLEAKTALELTTPTVGQ